MKTIRDIIRPRKESEPWNKGKIIGRKPPLLTKHVWTIRTKLQMEKRICDLALFNLTTIGTDRVTTLLVGDDGQDVGALIHTQQ